MGPLQLNKLKLTNNFKQQRTASTGLAKVVVQCFADTPDSYRDVVNQTLVLRMKIYG